VLNKLSCLTYRHDIVELFQKRLKLSNFIVIIFTRQSSHIVKVWWTIVVHQ